jgi:UMF1 family MFS transporter
MSTTEAAATRGLAAALNPGVRRREFYGWAMYDFANSAYTTVVITAVYNAWFVSGIAGGTAHATFLWTLALSISYAAILVSAPVVGAWADLRGAKKRLLLACTAGCVLFTALLGFVGPGAVALAMLLIVLSNFCYGTGENLAAAFLPELGKSDRLGQISGLSWAIGYLGGLLALGLCLLWLTQAKAAGVPDTTAVPATLWIVAAYFALAATPTFLLLKERAAPQRSGGLREVAAEALARTRETLVASHRYPDLRRFLVCIVSYQAGIQTVIALTAVYATQALGFTLEQTLVMVLVVNVAAALGAWIFGLVQDRLGHRPTLALTLWLWLSTIALVAMAQGTTMFWIAAHLAGLALGAAQSAGRALVGFLSPPDRLGEFYGLWGLAVKLSSVIGPLLYGAITWASSGSQRLAMVATGLFFVVGLWLLRGVDVARGRQAAMAGLLATTASPSRSA